MEPVKIEIRQSRKKHILGALISLTFVITSLFLLIFDSEGDGQLFKYLIGFSALFFFGGALISISINGFKASPGLIIDEIGILDVVSGQLVKWAAIKRIRVTQILSTRFILFDLNDQSKQLNENKGLKKIVMWINYKLVGTTSSISTTHLDIKFDELFRIINERNSSRETGVI